MDGLNFTHHVLPRPAPPPVLIFFMWGRRVFVHLRAKTLASCCPACLGSEPMHCLPPSHFSPLPQRKGQGYQHRFMLLFITKIKASALTDFTEHRKLCYFRGAAILVFFRRRYVIDYSVLRVVFTSSLFQVKACVMKVQVSSVNPKGSLRPWVPNIFFSLSSPLRLCWRLYSLVMTRSRQELAYSSYEKIPGFPNLLFVTKLTRIKENFFFCEKERKQSKGNKTVLILMVVLKVMSTWILKA